MLPTYLFPFISYFVLGPFEIISAQTIVRQNRPVSSFEGIYNAGPFEVIVNFGVKEAVVVEADAAVIAYIETVVEPSLVLAIRFSDTFPGSINSQGPLRVTVTARSLKTLTVVGSGPIVVQGTLKANDFQLEIDGSGDVTAALQVNNANLVLTGSGNFFASGKAKNVNINVSGSGNVNGQALLAQQGNIAIYASGNVALYCEHDLTVWITGSGSLQYGGNPTVTQQIMGSGFVTRAF
ncbi:hypothetical protein BV898_04518 [Hypsibius exemplaris]|uniref:Putative auto-transporter adhesin head GIN domain-containing protein n=1 Tax=Hypsibius exemplaris TaxID=2072580 RepID=A0A1W0X2B3_HYPEX|nr:hypothetical protein BV898_04518 [Hypsibius exemplaris]